MTTAGTDGFTAWAAEHEPRIRQALTAAHGPQIGSEATADALAHAWEHWDDVRSKANPAGFVFGVGRNLARRAKRPSPRLFPPVAAERLPEVEPGLPEALELLPERQRVVVTLLYGYQWTMAEVAAFLEIEKTTVQNHAERGLRRLRQNLGVTSAR